MNTNCEKPKQPLSKKITSQEVIDFLTTYLHTTVAEAELQYQEATN